MPLVRRLSVRDEASLFAPHPPAGLLHRMLTARTPQEPKVKLDGSRMERPDAELTRHFDRTARTVAWSGRAVVRGVHGRDGRRTRWPTDQGLPALPP